MTKPPIVTVVTCPSTIALSVAIVENQYPSDSWVGGARPRASATELVPDLPFLQSCDVACAETVGMAFDITSVPAHLGPGGTARPVEGFGWDDVALGAYQEATEADGADGRLVIMFHMAGAWDHWECHPHGDEVVIACTGRHRFVQELDDGEHLEEITAGQALINPPGVWHTADSVEPGWVLTITPGLGTEHRPARVP